MFLQYTWYEINAFQIHFSLFICHWGLSGKTAQCKAGDGDLVPITEPGLLKRCTWESHSINCTALASVVGHPVTWTECGVDCCPVTVIVGVGGGSKDRLCVIRCCFNYQTQPCSTTHDQWMHTQQLYSYNLLYTHNTATAENITSRQHSKNYWNYLTL